MKNKLFWLGKVIEEIAVTIDGYDVVIIKHHPYINDGAYSKTVNLSKSIYYCEEISQSADSMMQILLAWMVYKQLGMNQGALIQGIARMLKLGDSNE